MNKIELVVLGLMIAMLFFIYFKQQEQNRQEKIKDWVNDLEDNPHTQMVIDMLKQYMIDCENYLK